jgi:hypothetical protein
VARVDTHRAPLPPWALPATLIAGGGIPMSDYQPTPPPSTPYAPAPAPAKSPILSILSLIFGILGVLLSLFLFGTGFLPGAAAVVLGFLGRRKEPQAKGMWLTGLITGFVAVGIAIVIWIGLAVLVGVAGASSSV